MEIMINHSKIKIHKHNLKFKKITKKIKYNMLKMKNF